MPKAGIRRQNTKFSPMNLNVRRGKNFERRTSVLKSLGAQNITTTKPFQFKTK